MFTATLIDNIFKLLSNITVYQVVIMFNALRTNERDGGVALYMENIYESKLVTYKTVTIDSILECVTVEININKQSNKLIRTKMGKIQKEYTYPELFHKDDKLIESKENIANMYNRFITSVGPDLAKQIINPPAGASVFDYLKYRNDNSMFLSLVDENLSYWGSGKQVIRVVENSKNKAQLMQKG